MRPLCNIIENHHKRVFVISPKMEQRFVLKFCMQTRVVPV